MERRDKIVSEDRAKKFPNMVIVKILVILEIYGISYRYSRKFFYNHRELMSIVGIKRTPDFRTLSYRAIRMDWHEINARLIDLIDTGNENAAIDSFIVKTCKQTTAQRRRKSGRYKDPESTWGYGTKGFQYGRKAHALPVIDTNKRRGIVPHNLVFNRKQGIIISEREKSRYRLRWEIERTFSILEEILHCENIWYVRNRNYDVAIGERIVAYNCIVMVNQIKQRSKREIMDIVV